MRHHKVVIEWDENWNVRSNPWIIRKAIEQAVSEYAFPDDDVDWQNLLVMVEK